MMKFTNLLPKNNKKGVTLVELVMAVVVLSIFAIGIITGLTAASTKIAQNSREAAIHSEAVQKLDAVISVVSNGSYAASADLAGEVKGVLGYGNEVTLSMTPDPNTYVDANGVTKTRGWKISLTYGGVTVKGYTSNTEGVFDKDA